MEAVFGNCATSVSFRVSGDGAKALVREFAAGGEDPRTAEQAHDIIIPASELQNLPDYELYLRTLPAGRPLEPFRVHSFLAFEKTGMETAVETIVRTSQQRYGRDRARIEQRINGILAA
jgi:hypothetical protein